MRILAIMAFVLSSCGVAYADDVAVPMHHDGKDGVWFVLEEAQRLNLIDELAPLKEIKIIKLEEEKRLAILEIKDVRIAVNASKELADLWESTARKVERRADAAQTKLDAWYRQPVILFTVGALVGMVAAVAVQ